MFYLFMIKLNFSVQLNSNSPFLHKISIIAFQGGEKTLSK